MTAKELKARFEAQRVLVIGDVMLDGYLRGKVERISPEAPVPVVLHSSTDRRLGGAANVALNLHALGAEVALLGVVGKDDVGYEIECALDAEEPPILSYLFPSVTRQTTVKTRVLSGNHQLLRIDVEDKHALDATEQETFLEQLRYALNELEPTLILIQDYNKGLLTPITIGLILDESSERKIPVAVDPKFENFFAYQGVDLFKPNAIEVTNAFESFQVHPNSLEKVSKRLLQKLSAKALLMTLSGNGIYYQDGIDEGLVPTSPRTIVDVCGAGDAVFAVAGLGRAVGLSLYEIAQLGNLCGGDVCERVGVVPINWERVAADWDQLSVK